MPFLVDGNNLMFAMRKAGLAASRGSVCAVLDALARRGQRVRVVFDGPLPPEEAARKIDQMRIQVQFSQDVKADELILQAVAADTAPRRLTVVSSDRQIRQAARRRRCGVMRSEEFVELLRASLQRPARKRPSEPAEKRGGLGPTRTGEWIKEFGLENEDFEDGTG